MNGLAAKGIDTEVLHVLGSELVQYSIAIKSTHSLLFHEPGKASGKVDQSRAFMEIDLQSLEVLEKFPFSSAQQSA
jgi:hypothetical protein